MASAPARGRAHIGTSGWLYDHWRGPFYPKDLPRGEELDYYVRHFRTVELNTTFYHLPGEKAVRGWREAAPQGFVYAVKGSGYITHRKKLKDPETTVLRFLEAIAGLGETAGPLLFQLPPNWKPNPERLEAFLTFLADQAAQPGKHRRLAFELRDSRWFTDEILELLRRFNAAFVIWELAGQRTPNAITADFVYLRLHGPGEAYQGSYDAKALQGWAGAVSSWQAQGLDVFCYFDNDQYGFAAANAAELAAMVG